MEHLDTAAIILPVSSDEAEGGDGRRQAIEKAGVRLMAAEAKYIQAWRHKNGRRSKSDAPSHLNGLALSGGGIRSATFALGVMQALAHHNLLKKFDYLSTVSGGGYIGSALTWFLSAQANAERNDGGMPFNADKAGFPFGSDSPDPHQKPGDKPEQSAVLNYLRDHGHYLNPGAGINIFALLGVVMRGTLLNLIVWLPLAILLLVAGFWLPQKVVFIERFADEPLLGMLLEKIPNGVYQWDEAFLGYEFLLRLVIMIVVALLLGIVIYSIITWLRRSQMCGRVGGFCWYGVRRLAEKATSLALPFTLAILIIGLLPVATSYFVTIGPLALVIGIAMHLRDFLGRLSAGENKALGIIVPIGAALVLYGFFALAFQLGYLLWGVGSASFVGWVIMLLGVSSITGYFANLNYISVNRFYRDRLMENFMPDIANALANKTGMAKGADEAHLCCFNEMDNPTGPYHLINANIVLADSRNPTYKARGGDNFLLSPLYCGSNATGWCPTHHYMEGRMTLATAFAISGAAINPNAGVGGQGVTRNKVLSLVMSLLNLRLGYWAHNPCKPPFNRIANHFYPGAYYALGSAFNLKGFNEKEAFVELSDGGHFENMAVYELVRRKAALILVSDGGQDLEFSFSDFQTTIRRIEADFGARVDFHDNEYGPNKLLPVPPDGAEYPPGAKFSERGYMTGTIHYADGTEGTMVYLKSTMIEETSFKVKGYKAQEPDFPDQSTADQFFDDVQFEAYRELGFTITDSMIKDPKLNFSALFQ